jgi:threonine dehydratase
VTGDTHEGQRLVITRDHIHRAYDTIRPYLRRTPVIQLDLAGPVTLKLEQLQCAGSFKARGAFTNLLLRDVPPAGVAAASGGNHGVAVAYAAHQLGIPARIFVPTVSSPVKIERIRELADLVIVGDRYADALEAAEQWTATSGALSVQAFDHRETILGQATLGLELDDQAGPLDTVLVPVGGGGLISGIAGVVKAARPQTRIIGVQVDACAPFPQSLRGTGPITFKSRATIADGIAIKRPGEITLPLVRRWVDDMVVVTEEEIARAMVWLLERSKLVVEGGGAVGVAALIAGRVEPAATGSTVTVLSGGNVDPGLLAGIAQWNETLAGRRIRLFTRISDRPGGLATLLTLIAQAGGNVVHADHVREAVPLHVRETGVEIALETRGPKHGEAIIAALTDAGYDVRVLDQPE